MAILEVKNLQKKFGRVEVLKGIDFSLEKGEVMSIIGPSGGGKTTLLRCLNFLEKADAGKILVNGRLVYDGKDNTKKSDEAIRQNRLHFGLVFQSFNLFPQYNVYENVTLAPKLLGEMPPDEIDSRARALIERVGLADKINNYPCQLSGGQQQRVAIARALILNPEILCFDEPTSALDPELTGEVLKVIKGLRDEGRTMIIVTHEMEFAKRVSDKVLFIHGGVIEEQGSPEQVFDAPASDVTRAFLAKSMEEI